ncbi:MAG: hypothetical protein IE917_18725, partial [Betaproteobacteria bacterium]|nr:hypothetical protein [Betaproteobacteria bacterium]
MMGKALGLLQVPSVMLLNGLDSFDQALRISQRLTEEALLSKDIQLATGIHIEHRPACQR